MKYFYDTEFHEHSIKEVNTIELISIGIVSEDNRELYLICKEFDFKKAWQNYWIRNNVLKKLDSSCVDFKSTKKFINDNGKTKLQIKKSIIEFFKDETKAELWGYYADYDHVVLCWLFGRMIDLPDNMPFYTRDLIQVIDMFNIDKSKIKELVTQDNIHNALDDAKWNKKLYEYINNLK